MTHTLESEETPPPMPSSWRMFGSGEPMTERKIRCHSSRAAGRSRAWKITALDVPPRMNTAGNFFCGMGSPCGILRSRLQLPGKSCNSLTKTSFQLSGQLSGQLSDQLGLGLGLELEQSDRCMKLAYFMMPV